MSQITEGEALILAKLAAIEHRLDLLYVPVQEEINRQYLAAAPEVRKQFNKDLLRRKRLEQKAGGTHQ